MMTLSEWLGKQPHGALRRLSRETGISYRQLSRYIARTRDPRLSEALAIHYATGGRVRVEDMAVVGAAEGDASPAVAA